MVSEIYVIRGSWLVIRGSIGLQRPSYPHAADHETRTTKPDFAHPRTILGWNNVPATLVEIAIRSRCP